MFSTRWQHSAHSKTDRHPTECLQDTPFQDLDNFRSSTHYLASNIPQLNHAWFFLSVLSWVQGAYKSSSNNQRFNQLNCEVTRITNGYWRKQTMQNLNGWLPQHYTMTVSQLLTVDSELQKFTKLINIFFIISADYWGPYSSVFQNTWPQQQTL